MKKSILANDQIYHIYNRGVDKRDVFMDNQDYLRFIHNLFEFNDRALISNNGYYFDSSNSNKMTERKPRQLLVNILIFTLMPNHFHLLVQQKEENGIIKFMQKLGTGYAMYFNKKYDRVGGLFQGRFKAVLVNKDSHFIHLPFYIHANPLDLNYRGSTSIIQAFQTLFRFAKHRKRNPEHELSLSPAHAPYNAPLFYQPRLPALHQALLYLL